MYSTPTKYSSFLKSAVLVAMVGLLIGCGESEDQESYNQVEPEQEAAFLSVEIDISSSRLEVTEGATIDVDVDVENTGEEAATGTIELFVDDELQATSSEVDLEGGESTTVSLQWQTEVGDAGSYTAVVDSGDETDSVELTIFAHDVEASIEGNITDAADGSVMEGVEVLLLDAGADDIVGSAIVDGDGYYEITDVSPGSHDLRIAAPGLNPDYVIEESQDGENILRSSLGEGVNEQDLTVDWKSHFDLVVDGGVLDFEYGNPDGQLAVELPGCEEQPDGSWEPVGGDPDSDAIEMNYDPDGECFQINEIGVDLVSGELDMDIEDILFPNVEVIIEDLEDLPDDIDIDRVEVDFEWLFDDLAGAVDYSSGSLDIDIDLRILVGGEVVVIISDTEIPIPFGSRDHKNDCQLSGGWGGNVANPQQDTSDEQIGEYLHDSLELRLTTGDSGPNDLSGESYDSEERLFVSVDNAIEIGRLSEGSYGRNDPGGASCGELAFGDTEEDFAEILNDLVELPANEGSVFGEFYFLLP